MFQVMDHDQNGELSKAEFRGPPHVFTAADKDENGRVTRVEMEAFRARTGKGGPGGSSRRGPGRERTKFTTPHALDPAIVKEGHNRVVDSDGNEVPPQGRPIQQGYRLIRLDRFVDDHRPARLCESVLDHGADPRCPHSPPGHDIPGPMEAVHRHPREEPHQEPPVAEKAPRRGITITRAGASSST